MPYSNIKLSELFAKKLVALVLFCSIRFSFLFIAVFSWGRGAIAK